MKLYRNADGKWVGTQAEAGNKDFIEVPTSKPELLEWLNAQPTTEEKAPPAVATPDAALGKCPKCKLTPAAATRIVEGIHIDLLCERIEKANGMEIIRLTEAVIARQEDFRDTHRSS